MMPPLALTIALLAMGLPSGLMAPVNCQAKLDGWGKPWMPPIAERGIASWYGHPFHGRTAANGEAYDMHAMTAASRTLPIGTVCEVVCKATGRAVVVCICDRGPYVPGRIIDLSYAAAQRLGILEQGVAVVEVFTAQNHKEEL